MAPRTASAILAAPRGAQHAAVIGGGLLGLEAARRDRRPLGSPTTVVHLIDRLMERQLDAAAAALLLPALGELGVDGPARAPDRRDLGEQRVRGAPVQGR